MGKKLREGGQAGWAEKEGEERKGFLFFFLFYFVFNQIQL